MLAAPLELNGRESGKARGACPRGECRTRHRTRLQRIQAWSLLARARCPLPEGEQSQNRAGPCCAVHPGAQQRAEALVMKPNG